MKDLPSLNEVFSMVLEHERQNGLTPIQEDSQSGRWQKVDVVRNNALIVEKLVTQQTFVT